MDDPLRKTKQEELDEEIARQQRELAEDEESTEPVDIDQTIGIAPKEEVEETVIVNDDLNTTIISTPEE